LTAGATAAREAYEEAGRVGAIVGDEPLGYFRYQKPRNSRRVTICEVSVFLFAVERQLSKWPEKSERETRWFASEEAAALVAPLGLADIVRTAARQILLGAFYSPVGNIGDTWCVEE